MSSGFKKMLYGVSKIKNPAMWQGSIYCFFSALLIILKPLLLQQLLLLIVWRHEPLNRFRL